MKTPYSKRTARLLAAAVVSAGALATTGALVLPASATPARAGAHTLTVQRIASGDKLHHMFRPGGTGALRSETLADPDDITQLGDHIYVSFQNGVGPQGEASTDGNLDSTLVEFKLGGKEVRQWDVRGRSDGLGADPLTGKVIATVNEDANSSLFTVTASTGRLTHYRYNKPLPHKGGTDAISIYHGRILISASAPGTTGAPAPKPSYPAVYVVTLNPVTKVATVRPLFFDEALARQANGPHAGKLVHLALTDPDSSEVVPPRAPRYAGDFMLDSQGDRELIFDRQTGPRPSLTVLNLPRSVDDSGWVTGRFGALYTTDATADTVDIVSGAFTTGTMYSAVTPCDASNAVGHVPRARLPGQLPGHGQHEDRRARQGAAVRPRPAAEGPDLRPVLARVQHHTTETKKSSTAAAI